MNKWLKYLQELVSISSKIVVAVLIVTAVYVRTFWGKDCEVGIEILWQILICSLVTGIGSVALIVNIRDKMPQKEVVIRYLLHFIYVNLVVFSAGMYWGWFYSDDWKMLIGMEVCIIVAYLVTTVICYLLDYRTAEEINQLLKNRENGNS